MNRTQQLEFIQNNYQATKHHISKRQIRHKFFTDIQTEIQAYLLGLHASDGSVDETRKTFRMSVSEQDVETINLYKTFISNNAKIYRYEGGVVHGRKNKIYKQPPFISIDITSSELVKSLVDLGFGYKKTYCELHLPKINQELIKHFIRGYFDGDGCITCWYVGAKGNRKERVRAKFDVVSKTKSILQEIQNIFRLEGIKTQINYLKRDDMYRLCTSSKTQIIKIFNYLYSDSNFYLSRKYNKFYHYVNTEVTQLITEYRNAQKVSVNESNNPSKSVEHPKEDENVR